MIIRSQKPLKQVPMLRTKGRFRRELRANALKEDL